MAFITKKEDWQAWYNMMPGTPPTLHVTGKIDTGNVSDAYSIELEYITKSLPGTAVLQVFEKHLLVPREEGDTIVQVHYSEQFQPNLINAVIVGLPNGEQINIDMIPFAF